MRANVFWKAPSYLGQKKKRKTITPAQRLYIWEHKEVYGRKCHICGGTIKKPSDLEFDHIRALKSGGKKQALSCKDCNRLKGSKGLRAIQKTLGIKGTKKPHKHKPHKHRHYRGGLSTRAPKFKSPF